MHPFIFHRKTLRAGCPLTGVKTLICPSAVPVENEEGEIYCKHDAIFTLITAGNGGGDKDSRYDDRMRQSVFLS